MPGAGVPWGLEVVQPPKKTAHRLPGGRGRRQGGSSRPTAAGTGGAADTGEDAHLGPGGGRRMGPGPPRGSDLGRVRSEGSQSPATDRRLLLSSPNTTSSPYCPGPGAARTVKDRISDPGGSRAAPAYTSPEEMDHLPWNAARARDRGHDDPLKDARETHQQARRILTQQNSTCEKLDTEQYRQNEL